MRDTTLCPLCSQPNQCAMEMEKATGEKQPPCWCTSATFTQDLLARVPADAKGKACICPACARPVTASCEAPPG